ncbi:hypothetical protein Syun_016764 [Stephania yunnanensis]|uniref:Uncharacterized protein n=1 Tax=Stephania yunnanensis TaxID=152371 RepID=A0AAP0J813_9MAGN
MAATNLSCSASAAMVTSRSHVQFRGDVFVYGDLPLRSVSATANLLVVVDLKGKL